MANHVNNVPGLHRLLTEVTMGLHLKNVPGLATLLDEQALLGTIPSCGLRQPGSEEVITGYCQALFTVQSDPTTHTTFVLKGLHQARGRYPGSHELQLSTKPPDLPFETWVRQASQPLLQSGEGCVPVVITGLDVEDSEVAHIFRARSMLPEPALVRVLVHPASIEGAAELLTRLVTTVRTERMAPPWWPLFQATFSVEQWQQLKDACGEYWRYSAVAINPFMLWKEIEAIADQVAVAQFPIGHARGLGRHLVELGAVQVTGSNRPGWQNTYETEPYANIVKRLLPHTPVNIMLGPAQPNWSHEENVARVHTGISIFRNWGIPF